MDADPRAEATLPDAEELAALDREQLQHEDGPQRPYVPPSERPPPTAWVFFHDDPPI